MMFVFKAQRRPSINRRNIARYQITDKFSDLLVAVQIAVEDAPGGQIDWFDWKKTPEAIALMKKHRATTADMHNVLLYFECDQTLVVHRTRSRTTVRCELI